MIDIYYDVVLGQHVDAAGARQTTPPRIAYQSAPTIAVHFVTADPAAGTVTAVDVSAVTSWRAAVDDDFDPATEPMCRTLNADIDATDAATGLILVPLDAATATFLAAMGTEEILRQCWFELVGTNSANKRIFWALTNVYATGALDPAGGDPPDPVGNYWTKDEADARYLFKTDGSQVDLTDDTATNFTIGAVADVGAAQVLAIVSDGTSFEAWDVLVIHNGTNAAVALRRTVQGSELDHDKIAVTASISGGNLRLTVTLTAYGQNLTGVFKSSSVSAIT
jgi:hypothetical protein